MKQPAYNLLTIFDIAGINVGAVSKVEAGITPKWCREVTITDEAGNRTKLNLYADTFGALALSEAEQYAAQESYTAIAMASELPFEDADR